MRLSVHSWDKGYVKDAVARAVVLFNGDPQSKQTGRIILTADEEEGMIEFHPCNPKTGEIPLVFTDCDNAPEIKRAYGRVTIMGMMPR